jgi:hypothetical protein
MLVDSATKNERPFEIEPGTIWSGTKNITTSPNTDGSMVEDETCVLCHREGHTWNSCKVYTENEQDSEEDHEEATTCVSNITESVPQSTYFSCEDVSVPEEEEEDLWRKLQEHFAVVTGAIWGIISLVFALYPAEFLKFGIKNKLVIMFVLLGALTFKVYAGAPIRPEVSAQAFVAAGSGLEQSELWCSDSATNRWVTNDEHDFIPGSVVYTQTKVAVWSGKTYSQCHGTILLFFLR